MLWVHSRVCPLHLSFACVIKNEDRECRHLLQSFVLKNYIDPAYASSQSHLNHTMYHVHTISKS